MTKAKGWRFTLKQTEGQWWTHAMSGCRPATPAEIYFWMKLKTKRKKKSKEEEWLWGRNP